MEHSWNASILCHLIGIKYDCWSQFCRDYRNNFQPILTQLHDGENGRRYPSQIRINATYEGGGDANPLLNPRCMKGRGQIGGAVYTLHDNKGTPLKIAVDHFTGDDTFIRTILRDFVLFFFIQNTQKNLIHLSDPPPHH